jgi:hypothetical protein
MTRIPIPLARIIIALVATTAPSLSTARFTAEQIRTGISLEQLRTAISNSGEQVAKGSTDESLMVYRTVRGEHEITASYRLCRGRVFEESVAVSGGPAGFIRRITQFEREYGPGKYLAESALLEVGERNLLTVTWRLPDRIIATEYGAAATGISESHWVSTAIPSVCNGNSGIERKGNSK